MEEDYVCPFDGRKFASLGEMNAHLLGHHIFNDDAPYIISDDEYHHQIMRFENEGGKAEKENPSE